MTRRKRPDGLVERAEWPARPPRSTTSHQTVHYLGHHAGPDPGDVAGAYRAAGVRPPAERRDVDELGRHRRRFYNAVLLGMALALAVGLLVFGVGLLVLGEFVGWLVASLGLAIGLAVVLPLDTELREVDE
jgi:hypothetical protein